MRECEIQRMLTGTPVPAPRSLALDATGAACGHPGHLMTSLPGRTMPDGFDPTTLGRLADLLATIHAVVPAISVRTYQSWAWEEKYVAPGWAADAALWGAAFELLRTEPPSYDPCFIHRDFQGNNVLWDDGAVSGVVDWVEASIGPAWLDVAHCSTNIAIRHGSEAADAFSAAYVDRTGRAPEPYFDVMDVVGFLPPPGRRIMLSPEQLPRLEQRLAAVLARCG
jgi:aminoglycoside phosphotransferase (APT) family kinase protein